ncbi:phosphonate metabolism protein/1,5-bisphosphokinase (PRPP-forming) PhnN [Zestomonas carbonaria]|uniref:Ribose 1,5-bisphosphate phosphokinase PhnN n=1 Tax=Zestomonas carbonaria TaxID=2762745 RepID=A0A7U7I9V6_9GAMM|nr:phosphonate metabolism protein/1,5-bisphosphokinase (PRPP-forming) PhnN [Pseudomonas carbonaria]CAD5108581.1 Ribose 1,5-bisphosphate phosphokinase PhnN [Pseudomonas carbonaria]
MVGRLIYLMGPSGAGKDSVLTAAREVLLAQGCRIVRRVITRSAEASGEDALAVGEARFDELERQGAFAMSWRANGLAYGIPAEIDDWLGSGWDVLVNGSRDYWPQARQRYPRILGVMLHVAPEELRRRLLARGRETLAEIEARLARNGQLQAYAGSILALDNSGPLSRTVEELLVLLRR